VKPLLPLKNVGVLLRDNHQKFPLDYLEQVFGRVGIQVHMLKDRKPDSPLDLILAMGGDGTVLRALDLECECPVLGINYGTVGFLTAGDRDDLERLVQRLLDRDYVISERMQLRCVCRGRVIDVVNEVAIRTQWRMVNIDVMVAETKIRTIRGDGVIVGTPTGSTGYLLSTGGPIVMPDAQCFVVDGINEYNFTSRAVILPPDVRLRLRVGELQQEQEVFLYADGNKAYEIKADDEVVLTRSPRVARLVFFEHNYFFHNLASRLSWQ